MRGVIGLPALLSEVLVADHTFVSGQIARTTNFETAFINGLPVSATLQAARVEIGAPRSFCGDASHFQPTVTESAEGDIVSDNFQGKIATVYNLRDRGLVIISSCGHSGIVNTIRHAQSIPGISKVHAVVGGIHLAAAPDAAVAKTAEAFQQIDSTFSKSRRAATPGLSGRHWGARPSLQLSGVSAGSVLRCVGWQSVPRDEPVGHPGRNAVPG
jgi:hypothetical protein